VSGTLVVAEHLRGQVRDVTYELITAARELEEPVTVAVIASDASRFADQLNRQGVDEIVAAAIHDDEFSADAYASATETLIQELQPSVVLVPFTVSGMGYGPAVAARLELGFASDVIALSRGESGALVAEREFYAAKVRAEVEFPGKECVLQMLRPTIWPPAEGSGNAGVTEMAMDSSSRSRHLDYVEVSGEGDVDITTADFLLSIGRGIGERENIELFEGLAQKMGATLGVSRPLVDAGWMPASRQVGQSGKTVKAKVYLAFGISGAVQHLAGMKTSGTIIAVNTDPEAAIFNVAHYGATCDLFEVAEELEKLY
jgi:electron transfer flavoprotein alpha subunit